MNALIKELARDSGLLVHNPNGLPTKLEAFAKSIINSCLCIVEESEGYSQHFPHVVDNIRNHFGIE